MNLVYVHIVRKQAEFSFVSDRRFGGQDYLITKKIAIEQLGFLLLFQSI